LTPLFLDVLHKIVGHDLEVGQLTELFLKIDVNGDGTVDWDEFTNL
jgi:hypothetical protein